MSTTKRRIVEAGPDGGVGELVAENGGVPEMPLVNGFLFQCETCDEAADPPENAGETPVRRGHCAAHKPAPAAAPAAVKRAAEDIATERGWLPPFSKTSDGRKVKNPNWWKFAAAFAAKPARHEVTEAEFDKAVDAAINAKHG